MHPPIAPPRSRTQPWDRPGRTLRPGRHRDRSAAHSGLAHRAGACPKALLLGPLLALLVLGPGLHMARAEPLQTPVAAAVLPFADRRHPQQSSWLGRYLQERIARALGRASQVAVLPLDAAAQWQRKLSLGPDDTPSAEQLRSLGVAVVVQGATQQVLELADLELHARGAQGDLLAGDAGRLRIDLAAESPAQALARVLGALQAALLPQASLAEPHAPARWDAVEGLYTLLGEPIVPGDRAVRPALVERLRPYTADAALGGRAHEALAELLLEQALLFLPEGQGRTLMLAEALQHAGAALQAEPYDTHRQALKAELHAFLKQYYEAKTNASIARIRNPLEGLAYVVAGLVAGLSTGEASEQLERATALDPFLRTAARVPGSAPFQGGILEPSFAEWERLRASGGLTGSDDYARLLAEGIAAFDRRNWERADALLRQAAAREEADYVPMLYLNRIVMELGHPEQVVTSLRGLASANPQEPDILITLGQAEEASGDPAAAQEAYRKALAEQPDDARALQGLANTEIDLQHWPQAQMALRAVLQHAPESASAWRQLGTVYRHLEDWSAAEGALRRALELRPDWPEARADLDEASRHLGRPPAAAPAPARPAPPALQ
jgi:tetratricopeptide (TPR) repeat protein